MLVVGVAQHLGAEVAGLDYSAAAGGNVFIDHMPSSPDHCVAVYPRAGTEADSKLPYDAPGLQVIVRSDKSPQWGLDTWAAVYSVLHGLRNVTLPDGTYLAWSLVVQSGPVPLGPDENGRYQYSMNIRTEIINATEERPE